MMYQKRWREEEMTALEVKDVFYWYTEGRPVLQGINLSFEKGKMYVILGPSGCGKTTLLSLLGGLNVPNKGQILSEGRELSEIGLERYRHERVSFVFQNYNLIDYMTPEENVALTTKQEPLSTLLQLGLTPEEAKRNVLKLSGGQQQRVAIARALASQAPVILADEPTGNLDRATAQEITAILKSAAKEYHRCVIVVTHSNEVAEEADVVIRLEAISK